MHEVNISYFSVAHAKENVFIVTHPFNLILAFICPILSYHPYTHAISPFIPPSICLSSQWGEASVKFILKATQEACRSGLHLYGTFNKSGLQLASQSSIHTHTLTHRRWQCTMQSAGLTIGRKILGSVFCSWTCEQVEPPTLQLRDDSLHLLSHSHPMYFKCS